jgi:Reverse transcriptase (RNA-dependent DNA polymerase)
VVIDSHRNEHGRHFSWVTRQVDFVLAFPQAPVETDLYMEIPRGFIVDGEDINPSDYVLKLVNNLYGQKQAGRVWYKYLSHGLCVKLGFTQSKHDPCVFWRGSTIIVVYTDDTIVTGPNSSEIDRAISDISKQFVITHDPMVSDFLGVKIERDIEAGTYTLTQPHLIQSIITDLGLQGENTKTRDTQRYLPKYFNATKTVCHILIHGTIGRSLEN